VKERDPNEMKPKSSSKTEKRNLEGMRHAGCGIKCQ
jgi:hypothetical protein